MMRRLLMKTKDLWTYRCRSMMNLANLRDKKRKEKWEILNENEYQEQFREWNVRNMMVEIRLSKLTKISRNDIGTMQVQERHRECLLREQYYHPAEELTMDNYTWCLV